MNEYYVVIVETKTEEPMVHEMYLSGASYERAKFHMERMSSDPRTVRAAVAKLEYVSGNKSLLVKE